MMPFDRPAETPRVQLLVQGEVSVCIYLSRQEVFITCKFSREVQPNVPTNLYRCYRAKALVWNFERYSAGTLARDITAWLFSEIMEGQSEVPGVLGDNEDYLVSKIMLQIHDGILHARLENISEGLWHNASILLPPCTSERPAIRNFVEFSIERLLVSLAREGGH